MSNTKRSEKVLKNVIVPILLVLASIIILGYPLFRSPLLLMIDGPYYAVQARWILEKGYMKYPDPPLVFYIMALISAVVGDVFLGVKITAVVLSSLATLPWYYYFSRKNMWVAGIGAGLALVFNQWMVRMVPDFMKNATGILWLSGFIVFSLIYLEGGERRHLFYAFVFLFLTALTHILDFGVAIFYSIALPTLYAVTTGRLDPKRMVLPLVGISLVMIAFLAPFIVGGDVYKGIAFLRDVSEYDEYSFERLPDAVLVAGIALTLLITGAIKYGESKCEAALCFSSALLIVALNFPLIPPKWLFRFRNMNVVPLAVSVGESLSLIGGSKRTVPALIIISVLLAASATTVYSRIRPTITLREYEELKKAIAFAESRGYSIVIPDPRLRYWSETISDNVYKSPENAPKPICHIVRIRDGMPPQLTLWKGRFFAVVLGRRMPRP